jgi:NAD(P)-dependent dehydrogenase (short-subunit alcohol dehydrogenase family)
MQPDSLQSISSTAVRQDHHEHEADYRSLMGGIMKNVLITGCNSGFGYYTAECFAKAGHRVFATVRPQEDMTRIEQLAASEGCSVDILPLDVTDPAQISAVRDQVLAVGPLDVLVNNAGRVAIAPLEETPEDQVRAIFDVNVFGLVSMIQAFLPSMRQAKSGTIVNLSSPAALAPSHWYSIYAGSKAAVNALSKSLAQEVADWNIRLILVYPGNYKTEVLHNAVGDLSVGEDSPYYQLKQSTKAASRAIYAQMLAGDEERASRESGRPVGEAIFAAVFDGTNQLHYPVGSDSQTIFDATVVS